MVELPLLNLHYMNMEDSCSKLTLIYLVGIKMEHAVAVAS
jgi:hypothetical protein